MKCYGLISIPVFFISTENGLLELKSVLEIGCGSIRESIFDANSINWTWVSNLIELSNCLKIKAKSMSLSIVDFPLA